MENSWVRNETRGRLPDPKVRWDRYAPHQASDENRHAHSETGMTPLFYVSVKNCRSSSMRTL
jgi:hypothetical protein